MRSVSRRRVCRKSSRGCMRPADPIPPLSMRRGGKYCCAAAAGIRVIVDMHQDAWGKSVAADEGMTCPAGKQPSFGWDGAPEWATFTDGKPACDAGLRILPPNVVAAWNNFYSNQHN